METKDRFIDRYKTGNTPWDVGKPDFNLIETITGHSICKVLEIGCGTGDNCIWLAQHGFEVTGTDVSEIALEKAKEKASKANVSCDFRLVDFLKDPFETALFGFIFDRGCFHAFGSDADRKRFAKNVSDHLTDAGLWLTLVGNADDNRKGPGPPQRTAGDIALSVEHYFEILILQTTFFGSNHPNPPRAWRCLMQKRQLQPVK